MFWGCYCGSQQRYEILFKYVQWNIPVINPMFMQTKLTPYKLVFSNALHLQCWIKYCYQISFYKGKALKMLTTFIGQFVAFFLPVCKPSGLGLIPFLFLSQPFKEKKPWVLTLTLRSFVSKIQNELILKESFLLSFSSKSGLTAEMSYVTTFLAFKSTKVTYQHQIFKLH